MRRKRNFNSGPLVRTNKLMAMNKSKKSGIIKKVVPKKKGKQIVNTRKTQRNEPCPCGSGMKFKKCCLDESATGI